MRRLISFPCAGETLVGTLDDGGGRVGVLVVSGGNEVRAGAHRGMARMAQALAAQGISVFRFDRRGIGDSSGAEHDNLNARPDIEAALAAFQGAAPHVKRITGYGNCDAATALLLIELGLHALVLSNPWLGDEGDGLPPADAIRAHYAERVKDPGTWVRALTGGVNLRKLAGGISKISGDGAALPLEAQTMAAWRKHPTARIVLARGDATAIAFAGAAERAGRATMLRYIETDSHSFAHAGDMDQLIAEISEAALSA